VPPNIIGLVISGIFASFVIGMVATAAVKVAKAIAGRAGSPAELARVKQQLEEHAAALQDAQTQLADLQERVDFAERLLAQARDRSALGTGKKSE